jgi:hypothetical protein
MFKSSFHSKESSNSFIVSKLKSFSINSTKLKGGLQSILKSFGQFLFTNINLLIFFDCKQHFFKFVSNLTKEKIILVSICDPTITKIW